MAGMKPWEWITYGLLVSVVSVPVLVLGLSEDSLPLVVGGAVVSGLAGLALQVGVIAKGVEVGNRQ